MLTPEEKTVIAGEVEKLSQSVSDVEKAVVGIVDKINRRLTDDAKGSDILKR